MQNDDSHRGDDPVDAHVGAKVREARSKLGLSAADIARAVGASKTDIEDFEAGRRRAGSTLLCKLCSVLDQQISYFFSGYTAPTDIEDTDLTIRVSKLVNAFMDLPPEKQEEAYSTIKAMGSPDKGASD